MNKRQWVLFSILNDIVIINVAIIGAFLIRFAGKLPYFNFQAYTSLAVFITIVSIVALYIYDLYDVETAGDGWDIVAGVTKAVTLALILNVFLTFFSGFFSFPRPVFIISWLLQIILLSGWRFAATRALKIKWPTQRVIIVGHGEAASEVVKELQSRSAWGYKVIGMICPDSDHVGQAFEGVEVLGTLDDLVPLIRSRGINRVIITSPVAHREMLEELAYSSATDVRLEVIPELYEIYIGRVDHTLISDIPLVQLTREPAPDWVYALKRFLDIVGAVVALVVASPVMFVAAIAVKLSSPGPLIYKQVRVGKREKPFDVYKFRTMVENAEAMSGPVFATEDDPRITPVGRFLRRFRIDEFAQLINILKGEMSFVGPRPERPFFVEQFKSEISGYGERFKVKPGVTGLAQINGSYTTNPRNKLKYDLIYIYHQSLFLDLKIALETIKVLLTGRGAR
ncbi:MAG TPA: sugar transferase [Actinobacteria bacterium]|nr:sugar transferase [Actinomycetota bacterium]